MRECWPLLNWHNHPLWLDCLPSIDVLAFPYLETAVLSLTDTTKHAGGGRGVWGGDHSPALTPVRADGTTSRDGLPFSLGSGISSVKVTPSTENAAMHAGPAAIQHWLFPGSCKPL